MPAGTTESTGGIERSGAIGNHCHRSRPGRVPRRSDTAQARIDRWRSLAAAGLQRQKDSVLDCRLGAVPCTRAHFQQLVPCEVVLRALTSAETERYVALDDPLDCAGSFKWESLGITLFESMHTADPTALEGLPLIALCDLLRQVGVSLPLAAQARQH